MEARGPSQVSQRIVRRARLIRSGRSAAPALRCRAFCPSVRHAVASASPPGSTGEIAVSMAAAASCDVTDDDERVFVGHRAPEIHPAGARFLLVDYVNEVEHRSMKGVQPSPGITRPDHRRRVAGSDPAIRRRGEPQVFAQGKASLQHRRRQANLVQKLRAAAVMAHPADPLPDSETRAGLDVRAERPTRARDNREFRRAGESARPARSSQSSISTATCAESPSSKLSRIRSPRSNLSSCAGPAPTATSRPPARPRTPLIAKIDPPSSTRHRCRLFPGVAPEVELRVKHVDSSRRDPPDGVGVIERERSIRSRALRLAVGKKLLDDESRRSRLRIGRIGRTQLPGRPG